MCCSVRRCQEILSPFHCDTGYQMLSGGAHAHTKKTMLSFVILCGLCHGVFINKLQPEKGSTSFIQIWNKCAIREFLKMAMVLKGQTIP